MPVYLTTERRFIVARVPESLQARLHAELHEGESMISFCSDAIERVVTEHEQGEFRGQDSNWRHSLWALE